MPRFVSSIITLGLVIVLALPAPASAAQCWRQPVPGVIADPFREPSCPYCAGNRGIEFAVGSRVLVRAVASGTVSWAGSIAARGTSSCVTSTVGARRMDASPSFRCAPATSSWPGPLSAAPVVNSTSGSATGIGTSIQGPTWASCVAVPDSFPSMGESSALPLQHGGGVAPESSR